jgi:hypothetical protein
MAEQERISPQEQFAISGEYYAKAIEEGRMYATHFYREVFASTETEAYAEFADHKMISIIARAMNEQWVGRESKGLVDGSNK